MKNYVCSTFQIIRFFNILLLFIFSIGSTAVFSQFTYSDGAANYSGSWANGNNFGTGFNDWNIVSSGGNAGTFIGNPADSGINTANIGITAFGLFGHTGNTVNALRFFGAGGTNISMQIGDVFSFYWAINFESGSTGSKGFDLRASGITIFNVNNGNSHTITTTNGTAFTGHGTNAMLVTLTRTSAVQYSFSMTARDGGATYNTTINSTANINSINIYAAEQQDNNANRNIFFNGFNFTKATPYETNIDVTDARIMTGTSGLNKTGSNVLTVSGVNTYSGATIVTAGTLRLGATGVIPDANNVALSGGILSTGATAGFSETMGTLSMTASSTIALGAGSHTLTFANSSASSWAAGTIMTVTGWVGTNNGNSSGTAGRLFIGNTAGGLTGLQLSRIRFNISSVLCGAMQLSTGEIVPTASTVLYFGGTGTWNSNVWSTNEVGPFTSAWVSGRHAIFNVANSTITGVSTNVAAITANENVTVTAAGTLAFGPGGTTIATIFIESTKIFNFNGQALTTSATAGVIKNGGGILNMGGGGSFAGGFTLNAGIAGAGGVNGLGNGSLVINGGTVTSNSATARTPAITSITVNADFQLGDVANFPTASGGLTFQNAVALGATTRTITLGNASTQTFNGIISGTSTAGLTLAATAAGTLAINGANTYPGATTINGGTLSTSSGSLPNTTNVTLANTAGANLNNLGNNIITSLAGGGTTGGTLSLNTGTALTINGAPSTTFSGVISGLGALVKSGTGILTLANAANTFSGTTTINSTSEIRLNPVINATYASQIVLNGGKLSTSGMIATRTWTSSRTLRLDANSSIDLENNNHTITFANSSGVTWVGTILTINGWTGTATSSGTGGKIFVGVGGLTLAQLAKISFTGFSGPAILLGTGEVVPGVEVPILNSPTAIVLSSTTATLGATITSDGGNSIIARGTAYKITSPVIATDNQLAEGGTEVTIFTQARAGLTPQTQYFYAGYATNGNGTALSPEGNFRTWSNPPTAQPTTFTTTSGSRSLVANWGTATFPENGATQAGYIVIYSTGMPTLSSANGGAPTAGVGTLVNIEPTVLPATPALTTTITGLDNGTLYNLLIIPYTWDGANASTYNYLTAGARRITGTPVSISYVWSGASSGIWSSTTNWTPAGIPSTDDKVTFNNGTNTTVTAIPTISLSSFAVLGNTTVNMQMAVAGAITITNGQSGADLSVDAGSALNTNGNNALELTLATGATGSISGSMTFLNAANRFSAADANSLTVNNGSSITQGTGNSGNLFGSGTSNSVVFTSGSTFNHNAGANPFQKAQPASVVIFQTGSNYIHNQPSGIGLSFNGRTYGNLTLAGGGTATLTGGSPVSIDHLSISNNTTCNIGMTGSGLNMSSINGNINVASGSTFNANGTGASLQFNGANQTISGAGTYVIATGQTINIPSSNTTSLQSNLMITGTGSLAVSGAVDVGTSIISGTGTFSVASGATLRTGNTDGITASGAIGSIRTTNRTFNAGANYVYNGTSNQVTGNGLPTPLTGALTIANTGVVGINVVTLSQPMTAAGTVNLISGALNINGNTLTLNSGNAAQSIAGSSGNAFTISSTLANGNIFLAGTGAHTVTLSGFGTTASGGLTIGTNTTLRMDSNAALNVGGNGSSTSMLTIANRLLLNSATNSNIAGGTAPFYTNTSTLEYGVSYVPLQEWLLGTTHTTPGVPNNVVINGSGITITMPNTDRSALGNVTMTAGTFALNATSGDIRVGGNWTKSANAVFEPRGRAVLFTGTSTSIITASNPNTAIFDYLVIDKSSGSVQLANTTDVIINASAGDVLQLLDTGAFDLNGRSLILNNSGGNILANGGLRNITSTISGGTIAITAAKAVNDFSTGTLVTNSNVRWLLSAGMNFGADKTTINGTLQLNDGGSIVTNPPSYASTSTLIYNSGTTFARGLEFSAISGAGYPGNVKIQNSTTLNLENQSVNTALAGNLILGDAIGNTPGSLLMDVSTANLTVNGNVMTGENNSGGCTLTLSTATGGNLTVHGNITVTSGNAIEVPANANPALDGAVITLGGIITNSGTATTTFRNGTSLLQTGTGTNVGPIRYLRNTRPTATNFTFTYWGSPVTNQTLGSIWMSSNSADTFYTWNGAANSWTFLNAATLMQPGKGYIARARIGGTGTDFTGSNTYTANSAWIARFNNVPNNGNIVVNNVVGTIGRTDNLLANPYPSAIDLIAFRNDADNAGILSGNFYFWTNTTPINNNVYNASDYAIFNVALNAGVGAMPVPDRFVDAGQGFFAEGLSSNNSTSLSVTFKNSHRDTGNNNRFYRSNQNNILQFGLESNKIWLNITNTQGLFKQQLLTYTQGATNGLDPTFDAKTFDGNSFIDFYSLEGSNRLTIQSRVLPFVDTDVISLGFKTTVAGTYTIAIDRFDGLFANQTVFLQDNLLNIDHNLNQLAYSFNTTAGTFNNRFLLKYKSTTLDTDYAAFDLSQVIVAKIDQSVFIKSNNKQIEKVQIFDLVGRLVFEENKLKAYEYEISNIIQSQQVLIVKLTLGDGLVINRKIIF